MALHCGSDTEGRQDWRGRVTGRVAPCSGAGHLLPHSAGRGGAAASIQERSDRQRPLTRGTGVRGTPGTGGAQWRLCLPDDEAATCDGMRVWELPC
jgi:hypothetical protein